jgi:hypothetical protein
MDMQLSAKEKTYFESMAQAFNRMRKHGEFTDITLIFGGAKIPCHRMVVAWNCDYFKAMFRSGLKEKSAQEIEVQGIIMFVYPNFCKCNYVITGSTHESESPMPQ